MLPEQPISFPEFVADQLLTAKNLNDLFHYLDVQERGTRINLIGIGIVCGLELRPNAALTEIIITKGCGITSEGYLVRWDETKFENYKAYDAEKEIVYPPFMSGGKQKFQIDELKANSSEEGLTKLSKAYLDDKVVLLFVELLRNNAKNCDPESCDDKGANVTLTIRPLVVNIKDAANLTGGVNTGNGFSKAWANLPEIFMPRHHVPAEDIFDSGDVLEGFQQVMTATFLSNLQKNLTLTYSRLQPLVKDIYPANPFANTASAFAFIHNGTITVQQLIYMQYYYDLFSDVIQAYEELRRSGMRLLSLCCPDESLFPRHLLLGRASIATSKGSQEFRHYFIPSPAVCCNRSLVDEIRTLCMRLVLLLQRFVFDDKTTTLFNNANIAVLNRASSLTPIKVTPSKLGDVPLSEKAIPFYYDVVGGTEKLYQQWNVQRKLDNRADFNLSYHANLYATNDAILRPLHYDLEPYNFLRIEGHIGHRYTEALATINQIRDTNRLPFDVIALGADIKTLREMLAAVANSTNYANLRESFPTDISLQCHFQDLEALYDTMAQGLLCTLCKEMKYYYDYPPSSDNVTGDQIPLVPLLKKCDPAFRYRKGTIGDRFEVFYKTVGTQPYITPDQFFAGNFANNTLSNTGSASANFTLVTVNFLPFFAILYYIEKLSEILPTALISFNIVAFYRRYSDLMTVAQRLKDLFKTPGGDNETNGDFEVREDFRDHIDILLYACMDARFIALYNDYKVRWVYLAMIQKFGYYTRMHPGIQHKAGVPMGGTFIIVYHERSRVRTPNTNIFTNRLTAATAQTRTTQTATNVFTEESKKAKASKARTKEEVSGEPDAASSAPAAEQAAEAQTATSVAGTSLSNVHQLQSTKLKAQLTASQMALIDKLFFKDLITRHSLDELTAQLPDRIVIADFYLPYMCCSDCPPVYFIVNETQEPAEGPTISITPTQFCNADKTAYPITVNPAGGSFSNSEGVSEVNGAFVFNPSAVALDAGALNKIIALTYTREGLSASVNVTVFAKPKAEFDIIQATTYNFFVFSNKSTQFASVTWDFGDGSTATGNNPSHAYNEDGTYVVTLKAINGVCSDTISKTIQVVRASIQIEGKEFCSADKTSYPVKVSPEGGTVTGEGTVKTDDGFAFVPAAVNFAATQSSKDIVISYALSGQLVTVSVKVFRMPSATFTINAVAGAGTQIRSFQTSNSFPVQYLWDFGDGGTSVEANPVHLFQKAGTFVIKLTVSNGVCSNSSTQTLTIAGPTTINITPTQFCSADKGQYPIVVSPAGGQASGEGVVLSDNGPVFNPSIVAVPATQPQKTVTLSYTAGGSSAQVNVVVFAFPDASFKIQTIATAPQARSFSPNSNLTSGFSWNFGDGETSTQPNPTHSFKQPGTYVVTLSVVNGPCTANSSQTVIITGGASIGITPTQFCFADKASYPITVSPAGGQASGEGVTTGAGGSVFSPSGVALAAGQLQKTVTLSYVIGGVSAQTTVTVFATPNATFRVQGNANAPNVKVFVPGSSSGGSFDWSFGDGEISSEQSPTHAYKQPGSYVASLTITNGPCKATTEQNVVVSGDLQQAKTCGPLSDIIAAFQTFPKTGTATLFKAFTANYPPYKEIEVYFGELATIVSNSTDEQIKFFIETKTASLLDQWFTTLNPLVQASDVRVFAIALWRILTDLAMYIMCIQKGDFKDNEINLAELFNKLEAFIKGWAEFEANFSKNDDVQLNLLLHDIITEQERLKSNGEDGAKKTYGTKLNSSNKMITGYLK